MATPDDWAAHVDHVIKIVGPDHVGIGPDFAGSRSCVLKDTSGHPELIAAVTRIRTADNVRKIAEDNSLRVLDAAKT